MGICAVTGTNGKTSTVEFGRQLWQATGLSSASLGTLGLVEGEQRDAFPVLPPGPTALPGLVAELVGGGVDAVFLEAFSGNLASGSLDALQADVGVLTTLGRDHLDRHGSFAAYVDAKRRLFERGVRRGGVAIVPVGVRDAERFVAASRARGLAVVRTGHDVRVVRTRPTPQGTEAWVEVFGRRVRTELPLLGRFMVDNAVAAATACIALGAPVDDVLTGLSTLRMPPGRMDVLGLGGATVVVDFAHTPDGLTAVLSALRRRTRGSLAVVSGCGGDPGKRPLIGAVAGRLADRVTVTDHTPTRDDRAVVRRDILVGARARRACVVEIAGRPNAIADAIGRLQPGDTLLVAGRGAESYATPDGAVHTDRELVLAARTSFTQAGRPSSWPQI
ncbi:MAG: Mur ligase family protein [Myxococcota bacterium]